MVKNIERPHFYAGQMIDFNDFNLLASQPDRLISLLCKHLFVGGGIIINALSEFEVSVLNDLSVRIRPGMAILPTGNILIKLEDTIIDLAEYSAKDATLVVSLECEIKGEDKQQDDYDNAISGFKTERFRPKIVVSKEICPDGAQELFRVKMGTNTKSIRLPRPKEEWVLPDMVDDQDSEVGLIDLRFRGTIIPPTYFPLKTEHFIEIRDSLYKIEDAHKRIIELFMEEDKYNSIQYLTQLHSELLCRPLQPLKIAYLVAEFSDKFSRFLELLDNKIGNQRPDFNRDLILKIIELLQVLKVKEVLPRTLYLEKMVDVAKLLKDFITFSNTKYNLLMTIQEGLKDIRSKYYEFHDNISLGGNVFEKTELIDATNDSLVTVEDENAISRAVDSQYASGEQLSLKGIHASTGDITIKFKVVEIDRPTVLILRNFIRRGNSKIHYEVNGTLMTTEEDTHVKLTNAWINHGIVVPSNLLVVGDNNLIIKIERCDLDFGIYNLAVYRPTVPMESE